MALIRDCVTAALGRSMHGLALASKLNSRLISRSYKAVEVVTESIQEITNKTNSLIQTVQSLANTVPFYSELLMVSECLLEAESIVGAISHQYEVIVHDLVNAALGRVDSELLPIPYLHDALAIAVRDHGLSPIFDWGEIEFYYPLMHAFLTHVSIVIAIPMKSQDHFSLWHLVPFPFLLNGTVLQLSTNVSPELIMVDSQSTYIATTDYSAMSQCKQLFVNIYVCPAYPFVFQPISESQCELSLIQSDADPVLRHCKFEPVHVRTVYHVHMLTSQYFYFPNSTEISLSCKSRPSYVKVSGYYTVPDHCEVRASQIVIYPNRQHLTFSANLSSMMQPIVPSFNLSTVNLTVVSTKLELIHYLNDSDISSILYRPLPFYLEPTVIVPTVISPFALLVVLCCVCYCICRCRRGYMFIPFRASSQDPEKATQTA